jgi:hypothetical protein
MSFLQQHNVVGAYRSLDGERTGDHDQSYHLGWQPHASVPYPFNTRQYARLLVFRSRIRDKWSGDVEDDRTSWPQAAA